MAKNKNVFDEKDGATVNVTLGIIPAKGDNVRLGHIDTGKLGTICFLVDLDVEGFLDKVPTPKGDIELVRCASLGSSGRFDSFRVPGYSAIGSDGVADWKFRLSANTDAQERKAAAAARPVSRRRHA